MPELESLSDSFTFVQMNFWEGRLFYPIDAFLKREQPDIFSTQEMLSGPVDISPGFWTAETLVKKGHFKEFVSGHGIPAMTRKGHDFTMECTSFIKEGITCEFKKHVFLYRAPDDASPTEKQKADYYSLLHAAFRLADGSLVHILNHHGYLVIEGRMENKVADYNFKKISEYIETLDGPIILSGDFNIFKECPALQPLKDAGMTNLNDVHNVSVARNEFSWKTEEAVSHVFINDAVIVEEYRIPKDNVSDHLPLVMKCRVKRS